MIKSYTILLLIGKLRATQVKLRSVAQAIAVGRRDDESASGMTCRCVK